MDQWIGNGTHTCALPGAVSTGLSWELRLLPNTSLDSGEEGCEFGTHMGHSLKNWTQ